MDVINIETPQRADFQFNNSNGKILNIWSKEDVIQWLGTKADSDYNFPNEGPLGSRLDPKADLNLQLLPKSRISSEFFGGEMFKWIINSGGHSLQNDEWYQWQIFYHINKNF